MKAKAFALRLAPLALDLRWPPGGFGLRPGPDLRVGPVHLPEARTLRCGGESSAWSPTASGGLRPSAYSTLRAVFPISPVGGLCVALRAPLFSGLKDGPSQKGFAFATAPCRRLDLRWAPGRAAAFGLLDASRRTQKTLGLCVALSGLHFSGPPGRPGLQKG